MKYLPAPYRFASFLFAAVLVLYAIPARAYQMFRYLDARGKLIYVQTLDDVPAEFRSSASAVRVTGKEEKEGSSGEDEEKSRDKGDAVRMSSPLKLSGKNGKSEFTGEAKNFSASEVTDAKVSIEVLRVDGVAVPAVSSSLNGKGGEGVVGPKETVKLNVTMDIPTSKVKGFRYSLSWQTATITPSGGEGNKQPSGEK